MSSEAKEEVNSISRDDVPGVHEASVAEALTVKDARLVAQLLANAQRATAEWE